MKPYPENMNPDLLVSFLSKEASPEQETLVREWIMQSDENRQQFEAFQKIWEQSDKALTPVDAINTDAAWQKFSARVDEDALQAESKPVAATAIKRPMRLLLRVAAVLIPVLVLTTLWLFQNRNHTIVVATNESEKSEITLPDGTQVVLNSNSELQYPDAFGSEQRDVKLKGEAFFTVTPDKEHPFVITTSKATIKVLGTSFNVKATDNNNRVEVYVKTGKVLFSSLVKSDSVLLLPDMKGLLDLTSGQLSIDSSGTGNDLYWMNQTLTYRKTKLEDVFAELESRYHISIVVKDSSINNLRLTSTFTNSSVEEMLDIIAQSFNLSVSKSGDEYTVDSETKE